MGRQKKDLYFNVDGYNVNNSFMNTKKVYYNIYFDDKIYTFTPAKYPWFEC